MAGPDDTPRPRPGEPPVLMRVEEMPAPYVQAHMRDFHSLTQRMTMSGPDGVQSSDDLLEVHRADHAEASLWRVHEHEGALLNKPHFEHNRARPDDTGPRPGDDDQAASHARIYGPVYALVEQMTSEEVHSHMRDWHSLTQRQRATISEDQGGVMLDDDLLAVHLADHARGLSWLQNHRHDERAGKAARTRDVDQSTLRVIGEALQHPTPERIQLKRAAIRRHAEHLRHQHVSTRALIDGAVYEGEAIFPRPEETDPILNWCVIHRAFRDAGEPQCIRSDDSALVCQFVNFDEATQPPKEKTMDRDRDTMVAAVSHPSYAVDVDPTAVSAKIEQISERIDRLDGLLAHHQDKLDSILRPEPPMPNDNRNPGMQDTLSCRVSETMTNFVDRLDHISDRLDRLTSRVNL